MRHRLFALAVLATITAASPLAAQARPDAAVVAAARRLLDAAGVARTMVAAMRQAIPA